MRSQQTYNVIKSKGDLYDLSYTAVLGEKSRGAANSHHIIYREEKTYDEAILNLASSESTIKNVAIINATNDDIESIKAVLRKNPSNGFFKGIENVHLLNGMLTFNLSSGMIAAAGGGLRNKIAPGGELRLEKILVAPGSELGNKETLVAPGVFEQILGYINKAAEVYASISGGIDTEIQQSSGVGRR